MRNFDAVALTFIVMILLGFSGFRLTPLPFRAEASELRSAIRFQQTTMREQIRQQVRNEIQVLRCRNR
jgi:hypothetical protein